jgi:Helix-turn-helix.
MDPVAIGKFIAALRKEKGLTQEQFGEKMGVSNKTVSRWETGKYLPPAEVLQAMRDMFGISINEILSGKRLTEKEYRHAKENLTQVIRSGSFSLKERIEFFRKNGLRIMQRCWL